MRRRAVLHIAIAATPFNGDGLSWQIPLRERENDIGDLTLMPIWLAEIK